MASRCGKSGCVQRGLRFALLIFGCAVSLTSVGCLPEWIPKIKRDPTPPEVIQETPKKEQLVQKINEHTSKLLGWRSNDVSISTMTPSGIPLSASGVMAVQAPRNFRMIVSVFSINQSDIGSNAEEFWFWMRDSKPKNVFIAKHEDVPLIQRKMPIPFQPEWLMEALGVVPMDERNVNLYYEDREGKKAVLSSKQTLPDGRTVIQVVRVDARTALVRERILQNGNQEVIARAEFKDYKPVEQSGIWMPHRIILHWPKAKSKMTLTMGSIEVNPIIPDHLWQIPKYDGSPPMNLSDALRQQGITMPKPQPQQPDFEKSGPQFDDNMRRLPREPQIPPQQPKVSNTPPPFPGAGTRSAGKPGRVRLSADSQDVSGLGRPRFDDE